MTQILMISALFSAIFLVFYCYISNSWPKTAFKVGSIAMLLLFSIIAQLPVLFSLGLAACAVGDYFLSRNGDRAFFYGIAAFALGHIFYIGFFLAHEAPLMTVLRDDAILPVIAGLISLGVFMALVLWSRTGDLRIPVMCYIAIIVVMGITSLKFLILPRHIITTGAALFIASDFILAFETFILSKFNILRSFTPFAVWSLYWGAQFLLTMGVLYTDKLVG